MPQKIYRALNYPGVELRSGSGLLDYEPHLHDGYSVGLLTHGVQHLRTGRNCEEVLAGSVLFHEPYQVHENRRLTSSGFAFRNIEITQDRLRRVMDGLTLPPRPTLLVDPGLYQALMRAFEALAFDDDPLAQDELLTGA